MRKGLAIRFVLAKQAGWSPATTTGKLRYSMARSLLSGNCFVIIADKAATLKGRPIIGFGEAKAWQPF
ncbi:MAG: hypothetical protein A2Z36_03405 [Chloroflexi bacterium RBG_19FT_COMBO_48_23]|nr:MAG: hypothetical protein A2Z36_03405 [Chloroflexi bacterium RBG_19FT_COMBO_48_23]